MKIIYSVLFVIAALYIFEISANQGDTPFSIRNLFKEHDMHDVIPLGPNGQPVGVEFFIYLRNIAEADHRNEEVSIDAILCLKWNSSVNWSPDTFHGMESVAIPREYLWVPDISLYNSIGKLSVNGQDMIELHHTGIALWAPQMRLKTVCNVDAHSLASNVTCSFTFGLWANSDKIAVLTEHTKGAVDMSMYLEGARFEILGTSSVRSTLEFPCCPGGPYSNIKISISFKEKIPTPTMNGFIQGIFNWR